MWLLAAAPVTWLGTAATAASRCTTVVCGGKYGTKEYWDGMYRGEGEAARDGLPSDRFSWYCSWQELRPFWEELAPPSAAAPRVLVPGVGVDGAIAELFDAGWPAFGPLLVVLQLAGVSHTGIEPRTPG